MSIETTVQKTWGWEKWIENNDRYCLKMMGMYKDAYCSVHRHPVKDDTFYVFSGNLRLWVDGKFHTIVEGDKLRVFPGQWHSFHTSSVMTGFYEVSTGHIDEDVERLSESAIGKTEKAWKEMIRLCTQSFCTTDCRVSMRPLTNTCGGLDAEDVEKDGEPDGPVQDNAQG